MVIKLGQQGCRVTSGSITKNIPIYPCKAVDTTGAGDAFCGGFVAGMVRTGDPFVAAAMGNVSASFVVQDFGGVHALHIKEQDAQNRLDYVLKHTTIDEEN